jgi:hypothetical protein
MLFSVRYPEILDLLRFVEQKRGLNNGYQR